MEPSNQRSDVRRRTSLVEGSPVPLFERFDEELDDIRIVEPYRFQDKSLLLESIQREIENLLNTRLPPRKLPAVAWEPASEPQTVLDYGLPAFSSLSSGKPVDLALLRETVIRKIQAFEPRLEGVELELHGDPDDPAGMLGVLRGRIRMDRVSEPVCFPISLRDHGESATLAAAELS